eukprot:scaffold1815_cov147-Skeletonema_dohrnii-CCMP3373.AAC.6
MLSSLSIGGSSKAAAKSSSKAAATSAPPRNNNTPNSNDPHAQQRSQHRTVITTIHTKLSTLAKTVSKYPRKHRDLSGTLDDAVEALEEFKDIEWPPEPSTVAVLESVPSWMDDKEDQDDDNDGGGGDEGREEKEMSELTKKMKRQAHVSESSLSSAASSGGEENNTGTADEKNAAADATLGKVLDDANVNDEEEAEQLHQAVLHAGEVVENTTTAKEKEEEGAMSVDDEEEEKEEARLETIEQQEKPLQTPRTPPPQSRNRRRNKQSTVSVDAAAMEPMHPAVITTLHGLCAVISSESKTPKMEEIALDCIVILTNGRYVSGVAGGRMKLEQQRKMTELTKGTTYSKQASSGAAAATTTSSSSGHDGRDGGLSFLGYVVESITRASDSPSEAVQTGMAKALLAIMTCSKCGVHEAAMLQAVRSTFHVYLVGKSPAGKDIAKRTLVDMLKCVFNRMEAYDLMYRDEEQSAAKQGSEAINLQSQSRNEDDETVGTATTAATNGSAPSASADKAPSSDDTTGFASQYHTDSYLLFRALCKLSSKTLPGDENVNVTTLGASSTAMAASFFSTTPAVDPLALSSKILSLDLILSVFEHCGDAFRNGEKFIYAVQSYLCVSLLKNCMSNQTAVAHLSLKIFLLLVKKFKNQLKAEIEVFVLNIFLRVLESPNSPFEQKVLVLEALRALCADPQMLTQLFLNYDCDFDAVNLYKDIVYHVTRISAKTCAQPNSNTVTKKVADQELELSRTGLEVLVVILRSFLKALNLPGGDDAFESDGSSSLSLLRQNLKLDPSMDGDANDENMSPDKDRDLSGQSTPLKDDASETQLERDTSALEIVNAFDKKRTAQQNFEIGKVKFTLSLKSGLNFFIDNGFLKLDAQDMARFLHENSETLDKTQIGEVLGKEPDAAFVKVDGADPENGGKGFFLRVLHHYGERMDFTGLMFDDGIRLFLSGFRLPGEAQKIDRIMEKFAECFTRQNPDVFPSADTAFILGFSVIMLNTDLHNPSIKPERRMTIESFIRNNKGIADGSDLPEEYISGIFNRIKENPFSLKEDDEAREKQKAESTKDMFDSLFVFEGPTLFGTNAEEKKREKFRKEREEMMSASEQLFKKRPPKGSRRSVHEPSTRLDRVPPADVVKPMFDVTWGPLIGTLSQVLESTTNDTIIALCLSGFVYSIRLSSHSDMSLARNTFVNSLAKFTTLGSIKHMKSKNIECIRTLLSVAIIDGEHLGESWSPILQCISQLGRLHLFASGLDSEDQFLESTPQSTSTSDPTREMEENNGKAVLAAVNEVLIDKVFSSTVNLSARGVVDFIEQLIAVSEAEIAGDTKKGISGVGATSALPKVAGSGHGLEGPRIFSLQRLVEVADYNMNIRPRLTWSSIWETVGNHFARVGCHENAMVSMFAIDALRQLSFKFLEKPELTDFNFQRLFLKPFLVIMENPGSREDIRELILRCVDNIIRSLAHNLRSGWKIFFSILTLSSSDKSVKIKTLGLAILQRLLDEHLEDLCPTPSVGSAESEDSDVEESLTASQKIERNTNAEDFVELCRASLSFVQIKESDNPLPIGLSMRALCHTACYADLIADKKILPPVSGYQTSDPAAPGYTYEGLSPEESLEMVIWRSLLDGLASGICSSAASTSGGVGCLVQRGSIMAMRAILLRHGKLFSASQWYAILGCVLLPAIQIGAESDSSPVTQISSESPSVSSLDFLGEPLQSPPPFDDEGLQKFAEMTQSGDSSPSRPLGTAELLVEASFADLRHGGDGNLSKAYTLQKTGAEKRIQLQPFPDSWIATTAPIALGLLSDLIISSSLELGKEGREVFWPTIMSQLVRWSVGSSKEKIQCEQVTDEEFNGDKMIVDVKEWQPCEALVRIGCKEWSRVFRRVLEVVPTLDQVEGKAWLKEMSTSLSDTLLKNIGLEEKIRDDIVEAKIASLEKRVQNDGSVYLGMMPTLKTRCIASHCLQQYISTFVDQFAVLTLEEEASCLLDTLNQSRLSSMKARKDEDLSHAFQEACLAQWGDSVEEIDAAMERANSGLSHRGSSQMFFLTQEASATSALIILLSLLYSKRQDADCSWDTEAFAEPILFERIIEVLTDFLESEERDGLLIDPNVWRSVSERGGQVAFYCTSFAGVVVQILDMISNLEKEQFDRHKESLFPILCSLIRVQSDEIRHLVAGVFRKQIGGMIGVPTSK